MTHWADAPIAALRAEVKAAGANPTRKRIGPAKVTSTDAAGLSTVTVTHDREGADSHDLSTLQLTEVGSRPRHKVDQVILWGETEIVLTAMLPDTTVATELETNTSPVFILERAIERLEATPRAGDLADAIMTRVLLPRAAAEVRLPRVLDLNAEQQQAYELTMTSGLNVIWGPPGTGKTQAVVTAIAELLSEGASVLLVSNTNVAVDEGLFRAYEKAGEPNIGIMVRVGVPSVRHVAEHPILPVSRVCEHLAIEKQKRLAEILQELVKIENDLSVFRSLEASLQGVTRDRLQAARDRIGTQPRRDELEALLVDLRDKASAADAELQDGRVHLDECKRAAAFAEIAQRLWTEESKHRDRRRSIASELEDAQSLESNRQSSVIELRTLLQRAGASRLIGRKGRVRAAAVNLEQATVSLQPSTSAVLDIEATALQHRRDCERFERNARATLDEWPDARIDATLSELAVAVNHTNRAEEVRAHLGRQVREPEKENSELGPEPSAADRTLMDRNGRDGLGKQLDQLDELRVANAPSLARQKDLSDEAQRVRQEIAALEDTVIAAAQVVGTTLAQVALRKNICERRFDYVVIDEVSAVLLPMLVLAATMAVKGLTLLGDFNQNGPIAHATLGPPLDVPEWLQTDVFTRLGLDSPGALAGSPSATTLKTQYRFGPMTTNLANAIAYDGILRCDRQDQGAQFDDGLGEIVIVDPTNLAADAEGWSHATTSKGRGRWWSPGIVASLALAKRHAHPGTSVGIVTPYATQRNLLKRAVSAAGLGSNVAVATAHAAQGQQFAVVVIDLVEDGSGKSWVAQAKLHGSDWERDDLRLFNVALTRNAGRVYVVCSLRSITTAATGPLAALNKMLRAGEVTAIESGDDARRVLLDYRSDAAGTASPSHADDGGLPLMDSRSFFEHFQVALERAQRQVIIWSPFIAARRMEHLEPIFRALRDRSVEITVLVRPSQRIAGGESDSSLLNRLNNLGVRIVQITGVHEKLVVIDDSTAYIGSLNVLSNNPYATSEVMTRINDQQFVRILLSTMHYNDLSRMPICPGHHRPPYADNSDPRVWRCSVAGCRWNKPVWR